MFSLGDRVVINKDTVTRHIPEITIDNEVHEVIAIDIMDGVKYYVLSEYERNFFTEDELLDYSFSKIIDKVSNKPSYQNERWYKEYVDISYEE